jgi:membrane-associated protein
MIELIQELWAVIKPDALIQAAISYGIHVLALIIFLETGALVFFLPGDSLLVLAGITAANAPDQLNIWTMNLVLIPCAIIGDAVSYTIGKRLGPLLFNKPKSRFFNPAHLHTAKTFYERHGGKAIIMARFAPIVRTFVPVVAGMAGMRYRDFAMYNVVGGVAWISSMTLLGYFLGGFEIVKQHTEALVLLVIFVSILPGFIEWWRVKRAQKRADAQAAQPPAST